jgi:hypothetical protein
MDSSKYTEKKFPGWNADWLWTGLDHSPAQHQGLACDLWEDVTTLVVQVCVRVCVRVCVCMYACMYVYIYMYVYMYICIYTYMYVNI